MRPALFAWLVPSCAGLAAPYVAAPTEAHAQSSDLRLETERDVVGFGEAFNVTMQVLGAPGDQMLRPSLTLPSGFSIAGKSEGPIQSVSIVNGRMTSQHGLVATWVVRAPRTEGRFTIGPATVQVNGKTRSSTRLRVDVKKEAPEPVDPFQALLRGMGQSREHEPEVLTDPRLALPRARGQSMFLHASLERHGERIAAGSRTPDGASTEVYVGEQLTWNLDLYRHVRAFEPDFLEAKESQVDDCLKKSLLSPQAVGQSIGYAEVEGEHYEVRRERRLALFPLRAGTTKIPPFSLAFMARKKEQRESEGFTVAVREPPRDGRPFDYTLGDTGNFELTCEVSRRTLNQGETTVVTTRLTGLGMLPHALRMPSSKDIEVLDPEVQEDIRIDERGLYGGTRTATHIVRVHGTGDVALGQVRFPHFDPVAKKYRIASCTLGNLTVAGTASPTADKVPDAAPLLPPLPDPAQALAATRPTRSLFDQRWFHPLVYGVPAAGLTFALGLTFVRWRARGSSARARGTAQKQAREAFHRACRRGDEAGAIGATLRSYLEHLVQERYAVALRALTEDEARQALVERGAKEAAAHELCALYSYAGTLRYDASSLDVEHLRGRVARAAEDET
jgi:hypothetical protein